MFVIGWMDEELGLLKEHFSDFIKNKQYPSSAVIREFIKNNNLNRTVATIKSKLQHLSKKQ